MSVENLVRAARHETRYRTPAHKLVMLCLADSADDATRAGWPGLDAIMEWAGVKRSQAYAILADLQADGLIRAATRGQRGKRAEWVCWPDDVTESDDGQDAAVVLDSSGVPESEPTCPELVRNLSGTRPVDTLRSSRLRSPTSELPGLPSGVTSPSGGVRYERCSLHMVATPCGGCAADARAAAEPAPPPSPTADVAAGAAAGRAALAAVKARKRSA